MRRVSCANALLKAAATPLSSRAASKPRALGVRREVRGVLFTYASMSCFLITTYQQGGLVAQTYHAGAQCAALFFAPEYTACVLRRCRFQSRCAKWSYIASDASASAALALDSSSSPWFIRATT